MNLLYVTMFLFIKQGENMFIDYPFPEAVDFIKKFEGFSEDAYLDPAKVPTIGYGTTSYSNGEKVKMGEKISYAAADKELLADIKAIYAELCSVIDKSIKLHKHEVTALLSFIYNVGMSAFKKSEMLFLINEKRMSEAALQFSRWDFCGGKKLPGLTKRRVSEQLEFSNKTGYGLDNNFLKR
jgi:lysozyme